MIYFFTPGDRNLPSSRTRVYIVSDKLKEFGIETKITRIIMRPWWSVSLQRCKDFVHTFKVFNSINKKNGDVVYIHKTISQVDFIFLVLLFRFLKKITYFFDFDDAIFLYSKKSKKKTILLSRYAEGVIVGSHYLKDFVSQYNVNTHIIPTSVDMDVYKPKHVQNDVPVIGWIGSGRPHFNNLKILVPVFNKLIEEGFNFSVLIVGVGKKEKIREMFDIEKLDIQYIKELNWSDTKEVVSIVRQFDIGVMPLENNSFNKGKCAFKAIEYMACSVPVVCSRVGENMHLIKDEVNGFLVENDTKQWVSSIKKLILDEQLRKSIGYKGRVTIEDGYSYQTNLQKIIKIIKID